MKFKIDPTVNFPFKIGADPEFLFFHGTRGLDASRIISSFFRDKLEESSDGYKLPDAGTFGWDGASSTAEIRPNPESSPAKLLENTRKIIEAIHKNTPKLSLTTLSIGSPIGGHIHLELNEHQQRITTNTKEFRRYKILISTLLMPLIASDHRISTSGRMAAGYGKIEDMKYNDGPPTLEVRGLSAEWLSTPEIAYATFCYLGVIWNEITKRHEELIKETAILKTQTQITAIQQMMLADYRPIEKAITQGIKNTVKKFELYEQFKAEIDFILNQKEVLAAKEKVGWNITEGWDIKQEKTEKPTKTNLLNQRKISEILAKNNILNLTDAFVIPFNNDYNIASFAQAISDRIITLDWKLKNEYFLYGLKKEVNGFSAMRVENEKFFAAPRNQPHQETKNSAMRMAERFLSLISSAIRIDPKTGKTRNRGNDQVVIGIPYTMRAQNDTRKLIEFIWNIENDRIKEKDLTNFPVTSSKTSEINAEETVRSAIRGNDMTSMPHSGSDDEYSELFNTNN